jgi:hypothetical protein
MALVVEYLSSKCEALSSDPDTIKEGRKEGKKEIHKERENVKI